MFNYPNAFTKEATAYLRVFHASPDAPPVDVYANGALIASNLAYRGFTPYLSIPAGKYNIKVYPTGQTTNPVINTDVNIPMGAIITAAAVGKLDDIKLYPIQDPLLPISPGTVYLRFGHLSPNTPAVDIVTPDGTKLFNDVEYKEVTDYIPLYPGTYTVLVRPTGTEQDVLYVPNISLTGNRFYTIYAIGLANDTPPLQVVIPLDGNSYLR